MKPIEEELRLIRLQMEEDFLLHSERISAQNQAIERVEQALELVDENFLDVKAGLSKVSEAIANTQDALGSTQQAVTRLSREFRDYAHVSRSNHETWATERKRNARLLDVIQTGLLTGGLETSSRLEIIERRLSRLEDNQSGAA